MVDATDFKIIDMISSDSEISNLEIAKRLKLTESAVRRRIKNLSEKRIVIGYTARIRYSLIDRTFMIVGLDIAPEKFNDVINTIKEMNNVNEAYTTSGDHSLVFMADVPAQETSKFLDMIKRISGVRNVYPSLVQDIVK